MVAGRGRVPQSLGMDSQTKSLAMGYGHRQSSHLVLKEGPVLACA